MKKSKMRTLLVTCAAVAAAMPAWSQTAAGRPIRILVAAAPSTPADEQIRVLQPTMSAVLGQTLIVDNRGASDGVAASEAAARASADGHTLLLGSSVTHGANAVLYGRLPYDPLRDFAPITQLSSTGLVVTGHARLPGGTLADLAAHGRTAAVPLKLGSHDAITEFAGAALAAHLGLKTVPVRFKSSLAAMQALGSGGVELALLTPYVARPPVHAGRLKAFGITGADRSSVLPEVPTLSEQGIEGYELPGWDGLFAPAGTPRELVEGVHKSVLRALSERLARNLYDELGITPVGSTPQAFAATVKHDLDAFRRLAAKGGSARM
jgi:tripartite-type tricarboxylate transporter receptor subunit TctC